MNRPERLKKTTRHHKLFMMAMMPTIRVNLSVTCCAFHILLENELDNCVRMKPFLQLDSIINGPFQIQFVPFFSLGFLRRNKKVPWRSDKNKMLLAKIIKILKKQKLFFVKIHHDGDGRLKWFSLYFENSADFLCVGNYFRGIVQWKYFV